MDKAGHPMTDIDAGIPKDVIDVVDSRIALYRAKQFLHDPLADDTLTEWEKVGHTIEALEHLRDEITASPRPSPGNGEVEELCEQLREDAEMLADGLQKNLTDKWHDVAMKTAAADLARAATLLRSQAEQIAALTKERDDVLGRLDQFRNNAKSQAFDEAADAATGKVLDYLVWQQEMLDTVRAWCHVYRSRAEAAEATIQTLSERLAGMEKALEPFADTADHDIGDDEADSDIFTPMTNHNSAAKITVGNMRAARAALSPQHQGDGQ